MKTNALAQMEMASHAFEHGYSGQLELAPNYFDCILEMVFR